MAEQKLRKTMRVNGGEAKAKKAAGAKAKLKEKSTEVKKDADK